MNKQTQKRAADATSDLEVAKRLKDKRTNESTKRTYKSRINVMIEWLKMNSPSSLDASQSWIVIPMQSSVVVAFFGHLCSRAMNQDDIGIDNDDDTLKSELVGLSASSVMGYRSALVDLYTAASLELDHDLNLELKVILDGYCKLVNSLKRCGKMNINEGKRHLKYSGYSMLCKKLMSRKPDNNSNSWPLLIFRGATLY